MRPHRLLPLLVALVAVGCAPVRDPGGDLPYCEADDFEPSDAQEDAWDMGSGGTFDLVLCSGNEDWLWGDLDNYGYIEARVSFADEEHAGVVEHWTAGGMVGTTENQSAQEFTLTSWEGGDHWFRGWLPAGSEPESVTLLVTIEDGVIIGR